VLKKEIVCAAKERRRAMSKVIIEELPDTKEIPGAKRWEEERGEFVQVAFQEEIHHLAAFEIRKGYARGNHYHEKKEEIFYVFRGKIKASFIDMDTLQKEERILKKGDKIRVKPRCGHLLYGLEDTLVIEYSPQVYDIEDNFKINLG
jgi:dTDP-4-dehydrorhamnose 3,5-epimerase-like enzyme